MKPSRPFLIWIALALLPLAFGPAGRIARAPASKWLVPDREPRWGPTIGHARVDAEIIEQEGETYTLVKIRNTADFIPGREEEFSQEIFDKLIPESTSWVYGQYREQLRPEADDGYIDSLAEFDRRLENRIERLLLFKGRGLGRLIGTLEFTHRDRNFPFLPLEQAKGIRIPDLPFRLERFSSFAPYQRVAGVLPQPKLGSPLMVGSTLEVNKLVSDPEFRGFATSLLWTAAVLGNMFDTQSRHILNRKQRRAMGQPNSETVWRMEDYIFPARMEIRPHRRMIPYFEGLGFKLDRTRYAGIGESNLTEAARYVRSIGMQVDDVLMSISRDEWLKIPQRLLEQKREGARFYVDAPPSEDYHGRWMWEEFARTGLSKDDRDKLQKYLDHGGLWDEGVLRKWQERARSYQRTLPPEKRHWAFPK
jgi:hypothetical protein